ncbi:MULTISPECIES: hypothetical protein [Streptomycetaceae]|uniref:hypothetical protein n=1 Tax=Streptomycetaceae TaxID=2062 RepID=UPI00093A9F00|nr:hypothetical protein [Streptomyces sp. CB02056]OKH99427.1 hypothetical protein AMK13_35080 [Streptomyces sp. CB02056]
MAKDLHATLPVEGGRIASVPEVAEAARRAETLYGINLLHDYVARDVVTKHLRMRNQQDWYSELAGLFIIGGIAGAVFFGASMSSPAEGRQVAGLVAAVLAIPVGIWIGIRGMSWEAEKKTASVHFTTYVGLLNRARGAGLTVTIPPEWGVAAERASWEEGATAPPQPPAARGTSSTSPAPPQPAATQPTSWWPADAVIDPKFPVLPTAALARHWALAGRARELSAPHGVDFLDEQAVRGLLTAVQRSRRWISLWGRTFLLTVVAGMVVAPMGMDPAGAEYRRQLVSLGTGLIAIGLLAAVPALKELWTWRRSGLRERADAYLDLLIEARTYGVPVPVPPSWLDIRNRIRKPA